MKKALFIAVSLLVMAGVAAGCGSSGGSSNSSEASSSESESTSGGGGSSEAGSSGETIKVGVMQDTSGPVAPYGEAEVDGTQLATEQANEAGGLLGGSEIELVDADTASEKAKVPLQMRKLDEEGVVTILGPTSSTNLIVGAPVAEQLEVPMLVPSSSDTLEPGLLNEWTFRLPLAQSALFPGLFKEMKELLGFKTVAVFYDAENAASVGELEALEENESKLGYELVAVESSPQGTTEVSGPISKISAANPDVIYMSHLVPESAAFMKGMRARGFKGTFVGGATFGTPEIFELAGSAGEGSLTFVPFTPAAKNKLTQEFTKAFEAKFGSEPNAFNAYGYDAAKTLFTAIENAKSTERSAIRQAISTVELEGLTGPIRFEGQSENQAAELKLVKVEGGKFIPVSE